MSKPKVPKSIQTGNTGVRLVNEAIEDELGWLFREQVKNDTGIDAIAEIVDKEEATGQLLAIQIKSGESFFKEEKENCFIFRSEISHYNYWIEYAVPVLLVLCDLEKEKCYWVHVTKETAQIVTKGKSWKIEVPKSQLLGKESRGKFLKIAENISEYERKLQTLVVAKPLMDRLEEGNIVILEVDEWVNKLSGIGHLKVTIQDSYSLVVKQTLNWTVLWGSRSYKQGFKLFFPWAIISIDEDFYEDYDKNQFLLEEAYYDNEEDKYFYDRKFYRSWRRRKNAQGIRPYLDDGEVAYYRLIMELNDLGRSFLQVNNFLEG